MSSPRTKKPAGQVALVGAGAGDPGLLTVRAVELLSTADLVLADARVADAVLARVSPQAEVVRTDPADAVGPQLVAAAKEGRSVVRLLPGDPFSGEEGAKEADAVVKGKQRLEVVPGIPTATAVTAYAGIALGTPHTVARYTESLDWRSLSSAPGPLVPFIGNRCPSRSTGPDGRSLKRPA